MKNNKNETRHNLCSLQVLSAASGCPEQDRKVCSRIRTLKASLTVEAAAVLPLFMMFCMVLASFLLVVNLQMNIQTAMEETARSIGKKAYLMQRAETGLANGEAQVGEGLSGTDLTLMSVGINETVIKIWLTADGEFADKVNRSGIIGGTGGLYTYASTYEPSEGILDIVVNYDYRFPWIASYIGNTRFLQRCRSHVWIGESLEKDSVRSSDGKEKVYVTPNGSVYHTDPSCNYLDLSIHSITEGELDQARNASGAKYERCEECARNGHYDTVYITDYGTCWHSSLDCSGLKRTVTEVDLSECEGMRECSKCKNHNH